MSLSVFSQQELVQGAEQVADIVVVGADAIFMIDAAQSSMPDTPD